MPLVWFPQSRLALTKFFGWSINEFDKNCAQIPPAHRASTCTYKCWVGAEGWLKGAFKVADSNGVSFGFYFPVGSLKSLHSPVHFPRQPRMGRQLLSALLWLPNFQNLHVKCHSGLPPTPNGICKPKLTKLQFFSVSYQVCAC